MGSLPFVLLAITPPGRSRLLGPVEAAVSAGGDRIALLLRDPAAPPPELRRRAEALLPVCRAAGSALLVHGDPQMARDIGADGVHLPERAASPAAARAVVGPGRTVGASRHDAAGLAAAGGADYATLSPVLESPGKAEPLGLAAFAAACRESPVPVLALGGVTPESAAECRRAGAAGVAAIRAVWEGSPDRNVRRFLASWSR